MRRFNIYRARDEPFARALLMMFLVAGAHPVMDGNGRMARVRMNAERLADGENHREPDSFTRAMS